MNPKLKVRSVARNFVRGTFNKKLLKLFKKFKIFLYGIFLQNFKKVSKLQTQFS